MLELVKALWEEGRGESELEGMRAQPGGAGEWFVFLFPQVSHSSLLQVLEHSILEEAHSQTTQVTANLVDVSLLLQELRV